MAFVASKIPAENTRPISSKVAYSCVSIFRNTRYKSPKTIGRFKYNMISKIHFDFLSFT
jgi:hypothetical protein